MPQNNAEEQVLVIERKLFERLGLFNGLIFDIEKYLDAIFAASAPRFIPRSIAENDPSYKQLIPYVIMAHAETFLTYVRGRRAGESRLVGLRSIGIGGHINPADDLPLFNTGFYQTYRAAVQREVAEEVSVNTKYSDRVVALLNDESNEVGSVHLGVVHLWSLDKPKVKRKEQMITQLEFMATEKLFRLKESMETWSQLCLPHLEKIQNPTK